LAESGGADGRESPHPLAADRWSRAGIKSSGRRFRRWPTTPYQLKSYCSTAVCQRGAQVRTRWGRSLSPFWSTKMIAV
jgi:hypothetical protein